MTLRLLCLCALTIANSAVGAEAVIYTVRTAGSGAWSDAATWENGRRPGKGDIVQIRDGHSVTYDVESDEAIRMIHVAGTLSFSRTRSTLLDVGLLKVEPGETTIEDGFNCHESPPDIPAGAPVPVLEVGTASSPIPAGIKAAIRLRHFPGTSAESLPAIICCGGRWDIHGSPLKRTWLKLAGPAKAGDLRITLEEPVGDWRVGDRVIITTSAQQEPDSGHSFEKRPFARQMPVGTEERTIAGVDGAVVTLNQPLATAHLADGLLRCEAANLSRNVVVESADPRGVRGHTMYHIGSLGGISYAEFRHLGKEAVLGKYAIHFHLVRDSMRGSGVTGASIWDSRNRWITIHGTDHLLVRDCVGYQSLGHGFFLEDATEQWNVLDRNLAVQSFGFTPLPKQALPYDPNDGAGFWWANGRNTLVRNVACENDRYGFHFQIVETPDFNPVLRVRQSDGTTARRDVRTVPFLRFEDNESHSEGLFDFRFGDETHGAVRGDREHPFIVRNLRAWKSHYVLRPNIQSFLVEGLRVKNAAYGIYHPDYDRHVYRDIAFDTVTAEPLNGGHDETSLPYGDFTYDGLAFSNCRLQKDPLIQLTGIAPAAGISGHFRGVQLTGSGSAAGIVDFGGGPRTNRVEHAVRYYFHGMVAPDVVTRIGSLRTPDALRDAAFQSLRNWTGSEARAAEVQNVAFPELLAPVDDLPPATLITGIAIDGKRRRIRGVSHDNGAIARVLVNGESATITSQHAGVADWVVSIDSPADGRITASSTDAAGNAELMPHVVRVPKSAP